jgi:hypothetical protein
VKAGHHYPLLHKYALLIIFDIVGRLFQICASVNDVFSTSLLPGMLVFIEWFVYSPDMIMEEVESDSYASDVINLDVEERLARARWLFWTSCERFVNKFFAGNITEERDGILILCKNNNVALWEDSVCQGFLPFDTVHLELKLSRPNFFQGYDRKQQNKIRMARITDAARKAVWIHEPLQLQQMGNSETAERNKQSNIIGGGIDSFQDKHIVHILGNTVEHSESNNENGGDKLITVTMQ